MPKEDSGDSEVVEAIQGDNLSNIVIPQRGYPDYTQFAGLTQAH